MTHLRMLRAALAGLLLGEQGRDDGQTLAEYALILALIAVVVVVAVVAFQGSLSNVFDSVSSSI